MRSRRIHPSYHLYLPLSLFLLFLIPSVLYSPPLKFSLFAVNHSPSLSLSIYLSLFFYFPPSLPLSLSLSLSLSPSLSLSLSLSFVSPPLSPYLLHYHFLCLSGAIYLSEYFFLFLSLSLSLSPSLSLSLRLCLSFSLPSYLPETLTWKLQCPYP